MRRFGVKIVGGELSPAIGPVVQAAVPEPVSRPMPTVLLPHLFGSQDFLLRSGSGECHRDGLDGEIEQAAAHG